MPGPLPPEPRKPGPAPLSRRDGLLVALLLSGAWLWMAQHHIDQVDRPWLAEKTALHEAVLAERAPDPYQYKMWAVSWVLEACREVTGASLEWVFYGNTVLSLGLLVWLHHRWLRSLVGPWPALAGGLLLAALANTLFLTYAHQPHDLWGVALYCLLLRGIVRGRDWRLVALLCLGLGLLWEKHALVPGLWALWRIGRGARFLPAALQGAVATVAALGGYVATRLLLGTDRPAVDGDVPLPLQQWDKVLWYQVPWILPFLAVLLLAWRSVPGWVRLLWLQAPAWLAAYAAHHFVLHEVRSFWLLAPVFTATTAAWLEAALSPQARAGPEGAQASRAA